MPSRASGVWGVDARFERVVEVRTRVRWMCSFIRSWADWTEERSKGGVRERWAMIERWGRLESSQNVVSLCTEVGTKSERQDFCAKTSDNTAPGRLPGQCADF